MASIRERQGKPGTTFSVMWTQGGRDGRQQSEAFTDKRRALRQSP